MKSFALFVPLIVAAVVNSAVVTFSTGLGCNSVSQTYRGNCNFCADPPGDWSSVGFSEIGGDNRVTVHNQNSCTPASQVGQGFGPACWNQGATKLRSAWVACPGQRLAENGTIVDDDGAFIDFA
uniref:Asparaginase n=1 Tax=Flammulina velutipes TaxID=38945 RepID=E1YMX6_FLAVE|nr:asparaginase [Flammulina velutipes]